MQPINYEGQRRWLFERVLDRSACEALIGELDQTGFRSMAAHYPPGYRDNDRAVLDDPGLAARLFEALRDRLPAELTDVLGQRWGLVGLNARFRACRYRAGQSFCVHRDGAHAPSADLRSHLTFQIYLNDSTEFEGGRTRFYESSAASQPSWWCTPKTGSIIVFAHDLWHDGEAVPRGTKYVLRSDVMYARVYSENVVAPDSASSLGEGHRGYVWGAARLSDGALVSASRDGSLRRWRVDDAGRLRASVTTPVGPDAACAIAASGMRVLTGTRGGGLALWEVSDATIARIEDAPVAHSAAVLCARALGQHFVTASADGRVCRWDERLRCVEEVEVERGLWLWALSPRALGLCVGDARGRVWYWEPGKAPACLRSFDSAVRVLAPAAGGGTWVGLASGTLARLSGEGEVEWQERVSSGAVLALTEDVHGSLWFGGESGQLSRLARDGTLRQMGAHRDFVTSLVSSPDGRVISTSYDASVRIWAEESGERGARRSSRPTPCPGSSAGGTL